MKNQNSLLLSAIHFNSVERGIIKLSYDKDFILPLPLSRVFPKWFYMEESGYSKESVENEIKKFFNHVREFSVLCVNLQYADSAKGNLQDKIRSEKTDLLTNSDTFVDLSLIGLLKALESTTYQLEIEHVIQLRQLTPDEQNIMFALLEFAKHLRIMIIRNLQEYKDASWLIK